MTLREFYLERRRAEGPVFLKVLKALPADQMHYRPHEQSPSAEQVVWTLTGELKACVDVVANHRAEWQSLTAPPLVSMIELFESWSTELIERVSGMGEEAWDETAQFFYNGKMVSEQKISQFLWFIHFDAIHHRGQLSTYLRPMGAKVPAIYGPSGDERSSS